MTYIETYKKLNQLKDKYLTLTAEQRESFDGKVLHSEIRNLGNKLRRIEAAFPHSSKDIKKYS